MPRRCCDAGLATAFLTDGWFVCGGEGGAVSTSDKSSGSDDRGKEERGEDFSTYCARCLFELRQTRRAPVGEIWRQELAWHRTRLGALLTSDVELDNRIAVIAQTQRSADPIGAMKINALVSEAERRRALSAQDRLLEAAARRRLTADNLAELRRGARP